MQFLSAKERTRAINSARLVGSALSAMFLSKELMDQWWEALFSIGKQSMLICPLRQSVAQLPLWSLYHMTSLKIKPQWSCSLCTARLPTLSRHDRLQAIKQHIAECQKGERPWACLIAQEHMSKSLKLLNCKPRNLMPSAVKCCAVTLQSKLCRQNGIRQKEEICIIVPNACLRLRKETRTTIGISPATTSFEAREERRSYCGITTAWWTRLQKQQPLHAANFAEAVGNLSSMKSQPHLPNPVVEGPIGLCHSAQARTKVASRFEDAWWCSPNPGPKLQIWSCNCGRGMVHMSFSIMPECRIFQSLQSKRTDSNQGNGITFIDMLVDIITVCLIVPVDSVIKMPGEVRSSLSSQTWDADWSMSSAKMIVRLSLLWL